MNNVFDIKNLSYSYDNKKLILDNLSLKIPKGQITTILGENGSGKSTLFNILTKKIKYKSGTINLNNKDLNLYSKKDIAKKLAVVHQKNISPEELTVYDVVSYGRLPYQQILLQNKTKEDEEKIEFALQVMDLLDLKNEKVNSLSGGQLQRVYIALALAQSTEILLLDEPTIYLDIKYQKKIMKLLRKLNENYNITIIMILHDINQALKYSDNIFLIKNGQIINDGNKKELLTSDILQKVFNTEIQVKQDIIMLW